MPESIVRLKATIRTLGKDDSGARHPVGFLAVDEMTDVVERAERVQTFGAALERARDVLKEHPQCAGSAPEDVNSVREIERRHRHTTKLATRWSGGIRIARHTRGLPWLRWTRLGGLGKLYRPWIFFEGPDIHGYSLCVIHDLRAPPFS